MPMYEMKCPSGHKHEVLRKAEHRDNPSVCPACGAHTKRQITAPAFTPFSWGDTRWDKYDHGLGTQIVSKKHRERIMAEKGLVEDTVRDQQNRLDHAMAGHEDHEATMTRYRANLDKNNGDKGLAIAETFPVEN
jgi:putative FmdB family regulatory protein